MCMRIGTYECVGLGDFSALCVHKLVPIMDLGTTYLHVHLDHRAKRCLAVLLVCCVVDL